MPINLDSQLADLLVGVHAGWHAYVSDPSHHEELRAALEHTESDEILVAGHSQDRIAKHAHCITFGSPAPFVEMQGTDVLVKQDRRKARHWMEKTCVNFVNNNDPVPRLPFDPSFPVRFELPNQLYECSLPENSLTPQLEQYEHFCSHIMLNRTDVTFELQEPMAAVLRERPTGGLMVRDEHGLQRYKEHMEPLLQGVQIANYLPRENAPNVADSLSRLQTVLSDMRRDNSRQECFKPFQTTFDSLRHLCSQWEQIRALVDDFGVEADKVRKLHKQASDHLIPIEAYINATNNSIVAENWEDVS